MKTHTFEYSLKELKKAANFIIENAESKIMLFDAAMGMGKTTLIKTLCRVLGSRDTVTSPTFALVNEYEGTDSKIFHFDLYRIKEEAEALDIGFEEYLEQDAWVFIEWPDKILRLLPDKMTTVQLKETDPNSRILTLKNS